MQEHIGKILQDKLNEEGMPSVKDFATLVNITSRTLYNIFKGSSEMTLPQVIKASEILKFDLISQYLKVNDKLNLLHDPPGEYRGKKKAVTVSVQLCGDMTSMDNFPSMIKEVNQIVLKHGFRVS
jgi:plasmid maintenance system antidote protein VapI